jgi:cell division protein FtsL
MLIADNLIWLVRKIIPFVNEFLFESDAVQSTIQQNKSFVAMMLLNIFLITSLLFITIESTRLVAQNKILDNNNKEMVKVVKKLEQENTQLALNQSLTPIPSHPASISASTVTPSQLYESLRSKP